MAPARAREKSNSTRCLVRSPRPWRTPRFAGLMARWSTPTRSSTTSASSRSVPQRSSRSRDSRVRALSTPPRVCSPADSSTSARRLPTCTGPSTSRTTRGCVIRPRTSASAASRAEAASLIATFRTRRASGPVPTGRSLTSSPTAVEPAPSRRSICHRSATTSPANASSGSETSSVVPVARSACASRSRKAVTSGSRSLTEGRVASRTRLRRAEDTCGRSAARSSPPSRCSRSRRLARSGAGGRPASTKYASAPRAKTSSRTRSAPLFQTPSGAWNASAWARSTSTAAGARMAPSRSWASARAVTPVAVTPLLDRDGERVEPAVHHAVAVGVPDRLGDLAEQGQLVGQRHTVGPVGLPEVQPLEALVVRIDQSDAQLVVDEVQGLQEPVVGEPGHDPVLVLDDLAHPGYLLGRRTRRSDPDTDADPSARGEPERRRPVLPAHTLVEGLVVDHPRADRTLPALHQADAAHQVGQDGFAVGPRAAGTPCESAEKQMRAGPPRRGTSMRPGSAARETRGQAKAHHSSPTDSRKAGARWHR